MIPSSTTSNRAIETKHHATSAPVEIAGQRRRAKRIEAHPIAAPISMM